METWVIFRMNLVHAAYSGALPYVEGLSMKMTSIEIKWICGDSR